MASDSAADNCRKLAGQVAVGLASDSAVGLASDSAAVHLPALPQLLHWVEEPENGVERTPRRQDQRFARAIKQVMTRRSKQAEPVE